MSSSHLFDLTRGAPSPVPSTVYGLGWDVGSACRCRPPLPRSMTSVGATASPRCCRAVCQPSWAAAGAAAVRRRRRRRRGAVTPLRLHVLRPQALRGLFTSRIAAAPDGVVARRYSSRRTGLPSGAARRTDNEARTRTGLPGPAGWWPNLGSGDSRLGLGRIGRLRTRGAGGRPMCPAGGHLRPYTPQFLPVLGPAPAADSGSEGRPSVCRPAGHLIGWARREAGPPRLPWLCAEL